MADCTIKHAAPAPFKITEHTKLEDWRKWQRTYKWYATATNLNQQSHDVQLSTFKSLIGPEALEIYNTFSLLDITDVESVFQKFDEHFKPKFNLVLERFKLYKLFQKQGQGFEDFLTAITNQVDKCEFGSMRDDIVMYKIVGGVADEEVRNALLAYVNLNCETAIQICRASCGSHFMSSKVETRLSSKIVPRGSKDASKEQKFGVANKDVINEKKLKLPAGTSKTGQKSKTDGKRVKSHLKADTDECEEPLTATEHSPVRHLKKLRRSVTAQKTLVEKHKSGGAKGGTDSGVEKPSLDVEDASKQSEPGVDGNSEGGGDSSENGWDDLRDEDFRVGEDDDDGDDDERDRSAKAPKRKPKKEREETAEAGENAESKVGYPCEICGKVLASKSGRLIHRRGHDTGAFYSCYYCGPKTKFKQRMYLRRHIYKIHADILGRKPNFLTCDECGYQTHVGSNMKRHKYRHSVEKPRNCELCDYSCIVAHQMKMHMITKHIEAAEVVDPVNCDQCNMKFKRPSALKVHMLSHMSPEEREKHSAELTGSIYAHPCEYCGKVFTSATGLRSHRFTHTGEKPYACTMCDYRSVQQSSLNTHIKLRHSGEKPFICSVCGYACKLKNILMTHMNVHTGDRPYACDICGSRFKQHGHLRTHKKTHTGEKPFVCDICGHRWAQEGNLRAHMKIHRNQSGDPSQYSPPRKRKKKPKNDQALAELTPAPPSAIPPWSEQVATINPMDCFPIETPQPFHPTYPVHQGNPRPPAADCRYFQQIPQRQWPNPNQDQVQNQTPQLITIRPIPVIRSEVQHP